MGNLGLRPLWQGFAQVTFPPRRVIAAAIISHRRPVEHPFDASAQSPRSLGLGTPKGFQHLEDEAGIDRGNRQFAENRKGVSAQAADVRFPMLGATPLVFVGSL